MYQQPNVNQTLPSQGEAMNKLLAEHCKASLRTANRILRSKEDSEDAVQTVYCAAFRQFHRLRGESSFKTWILKFSPTGRSSGAHTRGQLQGCRKRFTMSMRSVVVWYPFPKVADQLGLTTTAGEITVVSCRTKVEHAFNR
jgi:hypothetical protein